MAPIDRVNSDAAPKLDAVRQVRDGTVQYGGALCMACQP